MGKEERAGARMSSVRNAAARLLLAGALASTMLVPVSGIAFAEEVELPEFSQAVKDLAATGIPEFKGHEVVERILLGTPDDEAPTLEELDGIDYDALKEWSQEAYEKISELQKKLCAESEAEGSQPVAPTQPEAPVVDETSPSTEGDEAASDGDVGAGVTERTDSAASTGGSKEATAVVPDVPQESEDPYDAAQSYPEWSYEGDPSFVMKRYTDDMDAQKLIAVIGEEAREVAAAHDVKASVLIAEAIQRSNSGRSEDAQAPQRNLFAALEYEEVEVPVFDEFGIPIKDRTEVRYLFGDTLCAYDTYKDCLDDMANRISSGIGVSGQEDLMLEEQEDADVRSIVESYELERYDEALDYETVDPLVVHEKNGETGEEIEVEASLTDLLADVTSHLGVPYLWGGTTTSGFDCSGLVQYSYREALQIPIPRTTYYQCTQGEDVDFADLHMGDLLFFTKNGVVGHVGMYLGEGCYIEAPQPGMEVKVTAMDEKMPAFAKRLVPTRAVEEGAEDALPDSGALSAVQQCAMDWRPSKLLSKNPLAVHPLERARYDRIKLIDPDDIALLGNTHLIPIPLWGEI